MRRHLANLRYFLRHKRYVFSECRKVGVPLWIALLHDWDKLLPGIWFPYARTFFALDGTFRVDISPAYTHAKMIHMRRNKHHWQHWVYVDDCGEIECLQMPDVYRREMLADWRGAAISAGKPDLLGWYTSCRDTMLFHPETRAWLERQLGYQA